MHIPIGLYLLVVTAIVGFWAWMGTPLPMPPSPLSPGEKLHCASYAPFRGEQNPLDPATRVDEAQIEDDLARLAKVTGCVRTYSVAHGLDRVAPVAARHGLKVLQGLWLSSDLAKNSWETETAVALANRYRDTVDAVIVGNEVLLRGEMAAADLAATIRRVKAQVSAPVTYAEVWEFWLRNRDVYEAVDFVTIHILPYWEDFPIPHDRAVPHVEAIRRRLVESFPGKEVFIGETGWPSAGRMRAGALPSLANQARMLHDVLGAGRQGHYRINVFEATDQPWKRWLEGTVGGHWGLFDAARREPKFAWGAAVSNHPLWKSQCAGGLVLATLVFAAAWLARRPAAAQPASRWMTVATTAAVAGALLGWTIEKTALESLGIGGWTRGSALLALAIAAPLVGAVALMRRTPVPSFAAVLRGTDRRPDGWVGFATGISFVVLCALAAQVALGLVFDPRYRDFPFTALTAGAWPFLLPGMAIREAGVHRGAAETVCAAVLGLSAVYIVLNEGWANWQALWFAATLVGLVIALLRPAGVPSSG